MYRYTTIRTYVHTYIRTYNHAYIHTYVHTYIQTCMRPYGGEGEVQGVPAARAMPKSGLFGPVKEMSKDAPIIS